MTTVPYNPETGEWTVFGDPRTPKPGLNQPPMVIPVAPTRTDAFSTTAKLGGDTKRAHDLIPVARQKLFALHQRTPADWEVYFQNIPLGGGDWCTVKRTFNKDEMEIYAKPSPQPLGPLHLNFDASVQDGFDGSFIDKNNGLPLYYNDLDNVTLSAEGLYVSTKTGDYEDIAGCSGELNFVPAAIASENKTQHFVLGFQGGLNEFGSAVGSSDLYSMHIGPAGRSELGVSFYGWQYPTVGRLYSWYGNQVSVSDLPMGYKCILSVKSKSLDISHNADGASSFTGVRELFLNGEKIDEYSYDQSSWGHLQGYSNRNYIYQSLSSNGRNTMHLKQYLFCDRYMSSGEMGKITDELAAKWGL